MPTGLSLTISPSEGGGAPAAAAASTLGSPTMAQMGATPSKQGDADMMTWPAAAPLVVDSFGKLILWVQWLNGATKYHIPLVSNDSGATWTVPTLSGAGWTGDANGDQAIIRLGCCHDSVHDQLHCTVAFGATDGVYYRQLGITRDGSNNITAFVRNRQMQLDATASPALVESPVTLWIGAIGAVMHLWSTLNGGHAGGKAEIRATYRVVTGDANDTVQANWKAPMNEASGAGSTDSIGGTMPVKYSCIAKTTVNAQPHVAPLLLANGNIAFAFSMGGVGGAGSGGSFYFNQMLWDSNNSDWRGGLDSGAVASDAGRFVISLMNVTSSGGDPLKHQRLGKLVQASATRVLGVTARWNNGTDEVIAFAIDPTAGASGLVTIVSVYSVGGAHSYAATCDCAWDATAGRFVATYIKTTTKQSYFKTYTAAMAAGQGETQVHALDIDEPYVYQSRINGKTFFYDRRTTAGTLPDKFYGYTGSATWS